MISRLSQEQKDKVVFLKNILKETMNKIGLRRKHKGVVYDLRDGRKTQMCINIILTNDGSPHFHYEVDGGTSAFISPTRMRSWADDVVDARYIADFDDFPPADGFC